MGTGSARIAQRRGQASALGIRRLQGLDVNLIVQPRHRDVIVLRSFCRRWGVPSFKSWNMLLRALTHPSVSDWGARLLNLPAPRLAAEKLAFVGDRALALSVAPFRSDILLGNAGFAVAATRMGIPELLRCATGHENEPGTLATAYEAIAGAVYLDSGINATKKFMDTTLFAHDLDVCTANTHLAPAVDHMRTQLLKRHGHGLAVSVVSVPFVEADTNLGTSPPRTARVFIRSMLNLETKQIDHKPVQVAEGFGTSQNAAKIDAVKKANTVLMQLPPMGGNHNNLFKALELATQDVLPREDSNGSGPQVEPDEPLTPPYDAPKSLALSRTTDQRVKALLVLRSVWQGNGPRCLLPAITKCFEHSVMYYEKRAVNTQSGDVVSLDASALAVLVCRCVVQAVKECTTNLSSLNELALLSDVGHRVYWLWLSEKAFHNIADGTVEDMQSQLLGQDKERHLLASTLGGESDRFIPLALRPCGKLLMFVALGAVHQNHGLEIAAAWLEGGYRLLRGEKAKANKG